MRNIKRISLLLTFVALSLADRAVIDDVMAAEAKKYGLPLQVEVEPLRNFYPAEEYHQDYLDKNPTGYCHLPVALFELARNAKERR